MKVKILKTEEQEIQEESRTVMVVPGMHGVPIDPTDPVDPESIDTERRDIHTIKNMVSKMDMNRNIRMGSTGNRDYASHGKDGDVDTYHFIVEDKIVDNHIWDLKKENERLFTSSESMKNHIDYLENQIKGMDVYVLRKNPLIFRLQEKARFIEGKIKELRKTSLFDRIFRWKKAVKLSMSEGMAVETKSSKGCLCDTCNNSLIECTATLEDTKYGDREEFKNVVRCSKYNGEFDPETMTKE